MTLLYTDDVFLLHETGTHPECAARLTQIQTQLERSGLLSDVNHRQPVAADRGDLLRCHTQDYLDRLQTSAASGGGRIESDTVMSSRSADAAWYAAGAVVNAVERVVEGEDTQALCLSRPPGHHALRDAPMGFCLLSNIAIAAKAATERMNVARVLVIDWDVHHGNGTQDAVYDDERITFFSVHRSPFYPGTGHRSETGSGAALGTNFNLPLEFGVSRQEYLSAFELELTKAAERSKPDLILLSAGFDAHAEDPVGSLGLENGDFAAMTHLVQQVAAAHTDGRLVSMLEGGYNVDRTAECVELHLQTLVGAA